MMNDKNTAIEKLRDAYRTFTKERNWDQYHDPKSVAASIVLESAELLELFQWDTTEFGKEKLKDAEMKTLMKHELADILMYVINFAEQADIDLTEAFFEKLALSKLKYPVKDVSTNLESYYKIKQTYRKQKKIGSLFS